MKKYLPGLLAIIPAIFLFKMIFFGEIVTTNDELARHPINQWRDTYLAENNNMPQWFPNLFSGMPSYGGYIYMTGDPTKNLRNTILFNPGLKVWFFLTIAGFGTFFILRLLESSIFASVLGGLMTGLTPYSFGLVNAGHLNKIFAIAYAPWVLAAIFYFMKKQSIKSICLLALATAIQLWANHPQIVYYTWMIIGFYFVWEIGYAFKNNSFSISFSIRQLGGIIGALLIAIIMVADPYKDVYTFQKHSNRGAESVLDKTGQTSSGTDWEYATQWSFHPKETISFLYPYYYGLQNFSSRDLKSAAYWGFMPFTQSTHYLGLVAIIFSILGALLRKPDKLDWFLWITTFLILLTGFGSFFPVLFKPFFIIFPFFSKFRIPSMIYALLAVTIPILAGRGYDSLINGKKELQTFNYVLYISGGIAVLSCFLLLFGNSFIDFTVSKDGRYNPTIINEIRNLRIDLFNKGIILSLFISLSTIGIFWGFLKNKINQTIFGYLLLGILILDLGIINNEFINVKPAKNMDNMFKKNAIIKYLLSDNEHFRIYPADEMSSNKYSYWNLESIGGYRPIKLRNYQDLMDAGGFSRPHILDMLNVKYILTRKKINNSNFFSSDNLKGIYENKNVLPKAWIVGDIKSVNSQKESLMETLMTSFNPSKSAIVLNYEGKTFTDNVDGTVNIPMRKENRIELTCQSNTGGLLVLSEIYYEPGWRVIVNGEEKQIYQTNHILRSVSIPPGKSEVIFEYDDSEWKKMRLLSRFSILTIVLLLGGLLWRERE
ncbi:MAG: hypothetical protein CMG55_05205 [Candidatus Marinimicrobia bacterium]|nr:hypothetical protein [Candidatus Neomarinimicrobiota bacterium]